MKPHSAPLIVALAIALVPFTTGCGSDDGSNASGGGGSGGTSGSGGGSTGGSGGTGAGGTGGGASGGAAGATNPDDGPPAGWPDGNAAVPAAGRQASDTGVRNKPGGCRETVFGSGPVEVPQQSPTLNTAGSRIGIDFSVLHPRQVDHQTTVRGGLARIAVSAAAYGHENVIGSRKLNGTDDVI